VLNRQLQHTKNKEEWHLVDNNDISNSTKSNKTTSTIIKTKTTKEERHGGMEDEDRHI